MALAGAAARREFSVARARTPFALPGFILASTFSATSYLSASVMFSQIQND